MTSPQNPEWKPTGSDAADIQGIIVSAYPAQMSAQLTMLQFSGQAQAKAWLAEITPCITDATGPTSACTNLALSAAGLALLGVTETIRATFSRPFHEGMTAGDRPRFLGDDQDQNPSHWTQWTWSDAPDKSNCVHALLMLYAKNEAELTTLVEGETARYVRFGLAPVTQIPLRVNQRPDGQRHEHFGFADGISQPVLVDGEAVPVKARALNEIAAGEVVLSQINTYGIPAASPLVPASSVAQRHLEPAPSLEGFFDLGRNGTYLVARQLKQDVAAFWNSMEAASGALVDEQGQPASEEWLAQKSVGRTLTGEMLTPGGAVDGNEMTFFASDKSGLGCPVTSHVRRANPRDGLAPTQKDVPDIIQATNRHRIMRRGRIYGAPIADRHADDGAERGLIFMCLNSDIERQFEFVQHTWMLNPMFGGGYAETDPLIGPRCPFTIPSHPLRQRPMLETYITTQGGGYFFLPSLSALRYLAEPEC